MAPWTPPLILQDLLPWLLVGATPGPAWLEDPSALLSALRRHCLTPWLYRELMARGLKDGVAPSLLQKLQHDYALSLRQAHRQEGEAAQVLKALAAAGVALILLKGADLRRRLYGDAAARPMVDLDLLVAPPQVRTAQEVLGSRGYTLQPHCLEPRPGFRRLFRNELHYNPPPGSTLMVDLHWELRGGRHFYRLPYATLAARALSWDYQGLPLRVLAPEHLVLHLSLHTLSEFKEGLQVLDLALALTRLPLDWRQLLQDAIRSGCQYPLRVILTGLAGLLPQAVPPGVLAELARHRPGGLERLALSGRGDPLAALLITAYRHPHPREWLQFLAAVLLPRRAYLRAVHHHPSRLAYLRRLLTAPGP
jgi:hypothetical protein